MPPHDRLPAPSASFRADASATPQIVSAMPSHAIVESRSPRKTTDSTTATAAYAANTGLTTATGPSCRAR